MIAMTSFTLPTPDACVRRHPAAPRRFPRGRRAPRGSPAGLRVPASHQETCRVRRREDGAFDSSSRSEEHTSELQSLMRISSAVFCLKKKNTYKETHIIVHTNTNRVD